MNGTTPSEAEATPWYLKNYQEQYSAKGTQRLLSKVEAAAAQQIAKRNESRDETLLHPSDLAKNTWCPRATYYRLTDTTESNPDSSSLRRLNVFTEGHAIHDKWQKWMWDTGCLSGDFYCTRCHHRWTGKSPESCPDCGVGRYALEYREVPLYDKDLKIIGHADGAWEDSLGKALVEIKSIGLGTIRWDAPDLYSGYEKGELSLDDLWKRIKRPLLPHRRQINLYMHLAGTYDAIVIYEWKPTQEVKEFHLSYDPAIVQPMLDGAKLVNEAVAAGTLPDRPEHAKKSSQMCKFCHYKSECWG